MKKSKFSDSQIMEAFKRVESGLGMFSGLPKQKSARKALVCWLSGGEGVRFFIVSRKIMQKQER